MPAALQTCLQLPFSAFLLSQKWFFFSLLVCVPDPTSFPLLTRPSLSRVFIHSLLVSSSMFVFNHAHISSVFTQTSPSPHPLEALILQLDIMKELPYPSITSLIFLSNLQSGFCPHCSCASVLAKVTSCKLSYRFFCKDQLVYRLGL